MASARCVGALLAAVGALVASPAGAEEKPGKGTPYLEKQTGIAFPETVGDLLRGNAREYEEPGLGVSVPYNCNPVATATATIYVYNMGLKEIPSDAENDVIKKQADQALAEVQAFAKLKHYPDLRVEGRGVVPLAADEKGQKAQRIVLTFGPESERVTSYIYVAGYRNHFVKMRYTYTAPSREKAEEQLAALTRWLGGAIREKPAGAKGD